MALQVELVPVEQLLLRSDGVLASLHICMTGVHQHIVPRSWGIVLNICYMNAAPTDFPFVREAVGKACKNQNVGS